MVSFPSTTQTFRRKTLRKQLILAFCLFALAEAVGFGIVGFWALRKESESSASLVEITRALNATRDLSQDLGNLLLYSQRAASDTDALAGVQSSIASVRTHLEDCATSSCHFGSGYSASTTVASIRPPLAGAFQSFDTLLTSPTTGQAEVASWSTDFSPVFSDAQVRMSRMSTALLARFNREVKAVEEVRVQTQRGFFVVIVIGLVLAFGAASFSAYRLLQPLGQLMMAIRKTGEGSLAETVEVEGPEEIRELARSFNVMTARLQQSQDKLRRQAEEQYRSVIQTSMDGFWFNDRDGRIVDVNDAYCQLIGYSREELVGMSVSNIEAKETPEETRRHMAVVMQSGQDCFETRHRRKDGGHRYWSRHR